MNEPDPSDGPGLWSQWDQGELRVSRLHRDTSVTPGTPKERVDILRKAFAATMQDPEFLADAKRARLALNFQSGEKIDKRVSQILTMSPKTKEKLSFLVRGKKKKK